MQKQYLDLRAELKMIPGKAFVYKMGETGSVVVSSWPPEFSERVKKADTLTVSRRIESVDELKPGDVLAELYGEKENTDLRPLEPGESPSHICLREVLGIDPIRGIIFYYDMFAGDVSLETLTLDPDWPLYRARLATKENASIRVEQITDAFLFVVHLPDLEEAPPGEGYVAFLVNPETEAKEGETAFDLATGNLVKAPKNPVGLFSIEHMAYSAELARCVSRERIDEAVREQIVVTADRRAAPAMATG